MAYLEITLKVPTVNRPATTGLYDTFFNQNLANYR